MQTFRAMNTDVSVVLPGCDAALEAAHAKRVQHVFTENERRFSRFRADSELSALNRSVGPTRVSTEMFEVLVRARRYAALTDGLFDPSVGGALVELGYDRSFAPGALDREAPADPVARTSFLDVELDARTRTVMLPPHALLDLGGMVKGMTVDQAASLLPLPGVIDAGGDCALRSDDDEGYLVDVEHPNDPDRVLLTLRVENASVATSAGNRRRWFVGGELRHHLVDPRTGGCSHADLAQVTVLAANTELADVLAKTAFLLGENEALAFLGRQPDIAAVLVRRDGTVRTFGELEVQDA